MTPDELAKIRERAEKATPGPWGFGEPYKNDEYFDLHSHSLEAPKEVCGEPYGVISALGQSSDSFWIRNPADVDFIQNSREDIPKLLAEIDRLQGIVGRLERILFPLKEIFESLHRTIVFHSKDFSLHKRDFWLYGVLVGHRINYVERPPALRDCSREDWERMHRYNEVVETIREELPNAKT
jgi:hypothetical protein